ncbi:DNA polymerase [Xylanibacillus composti]|uniref:DNA polymerase n=1 Tax=Xylanibacillus composti TaxID=1572762 RepID=A0A8J4H0H3_9BACL|nr:DNA-processing protein DprA [Xylanibacillus composti]GIQ68657.1 DNA polymerase [Xylanibacillus composti]
MDKKWLLFGLHEMEGVGWKSIAGIVEATHNLEMDVEEGKGGWLSDALLARAGVRKDIAGKVRDTLTASFIERRREAYEKANIGIITRFDDTYPSLLKHADSPPWILYYKGDLKMLQLPQIAIVGTRVPTAYGKHVAQQLGQELSERGYAVVSGMARGIDAAAHAGALSGCGGTIAVLGAGPERIYPPENRVLYERIAEKGLILSEYPLGSALHPIKFPRRNRIIAGLSFGTVVVEAAERSGALITADMAASANREVFIVPGPITSPKSRGVLKLWGEYSVTPVWSADGVEAGISHLLTPDWKAAMNERTGSKAAVPAGNLPGLQDAQPLSEDERRILDILANAPASIDELEAATKFPFGHLHSVLLSLLMKKKIEQKSGSYFHFITY